MRQALLRDYRAGRLSRREFLARATALGALPALPFGKPARAQSGGTLRIASPVLSLGDPRTWTRSEVAHVARGWLEYLVEYQPDGTFAPMLLERWETTEDGLTLTLVLRDGVTWSNGDAFTAEDVAHNIARWCEDVPGNSMAARLGALIDPETKALREGALKVMDDLTLVLTLLRPDITVIPSFADYPAAIVHRSYDGGDLLAAPLGTGPFLPGDVVPGERAVLTAREGWWGTPVVGGPNLTRIEFTDYGGDGRATTRALVAGDVDLLVETPVQFVEALDAQGFPRSEVQSAATFVLRGRATAEIEGFRPYENVDVRRALQLAIDPEALRDIAFAGLGDVAAHHHVTPGQPDYAEVGAARFAPREVPAMVAGAGLRGFPHRLISTQEATDAARVMGAMLRDAGLMVEDVTLPPDEYWAGWTAHALSVTEWAARPLGIQTLVLAYGSGSAWNETGYSNPAFDAKLEQAVALSNDADRRVAMAELQTMLIEDAVITQPHWRSLVRHSRVNLTGAEMHPLGELRLYQLGFVA